MHVAEKDIPKDSGLKSAKTGLENTITLKIKKQDSSEFFQKLDLIQSISLFEKMSIKNAKIFLEVATIDHYRPGETVIKEGAYGIKFYVIVRGVAKIFNNKIDDPVEIYA